MLEILKLKEDITFDEFNKLNNGLTKKQTLEYFENNYKDQS